MTLIILGILAAIIGVVVYTVKHHTNSDQNKTINAVDLEENETIHKEIEYTYHAEGLKTLSEEDFKDYEDETAMAVKNVIKQKLEDERTQKELSKIEEQIVQNKKEWGEKIEKLSEIIEKRKVFITSENFYPRSYATKLTELEVNLERAKEWLHKNPMKDQTHIGKLILEEKDKVDQYLEIKVKVTKLLEDLKEYESTLKTKKLIVDFNLKKQSLMFNLQEGNLKKARLNYQSLRSKIKS